MLGGPALPYLLRGCRLRAAVAALRPNRPVQWACYDGFCLRGVARCRLLVCDGGGSTQRRTCLPFTASDPRQFASFAMPWPGWVCRSRTI